MFSFQVPGSAKRLWDEWNLRVAVLISLLLQLVLISFASSRKRMESRALRAVIWLFYLLADWIAAFSVGLISSGQFNDCPEKVAVSKDVAAFWAPFLLLHLGGPDAITAFSLEDNELWIRHLLGLIFQVTAVVYVFTQSLPNQFWIPTLLMLFAGSCKYGERTRALYQACLGNFKSSLLPDPDSGPNYAQLMEEYSAMENSHLPVKIDIVKEPEKIGNQGPLNSQLSEEILDDNSIIVNGYKYFNIFKGLIVDHMFSFHERNESRTFFFQRTAGDAFKVMEVELNFMYDALYTKMAMVQSKIGYLFRFICTVLLIFSFQQFASHSKHNNIFHFDRIVTYVLLVGAVGLDCVAYWHLVFSDWTIVLAKKRKISLSFRKIRHGKRWCNTMSQHSLFKFCLNERFRWLNFDGIFRYKRDLIQFEDDLKEFLFNELKTKAEKAQTTKVAKEIYSARGDWVLLNYPSHYSYPSISSSVSEEVEYDESLILWHIATELCYFITSDNHEDQNRKFSRVISNYMLSLLVMKPTLMSAVAGIAQIRYQDTCEEAKKFFKRWESELTRNDSRLSPDEIQRLACEKLVNVKTVVKPNEVKGDRSKSLLFDACILANDLMKLGDERRWEMMSKVWVELLSYGASHCRPNAHAQQLSKGGELITFVWLQMAHFGLGEQFRIEAGHARAKLIATK